MERGGDGIPESNILASGGERGETWKLVDSVSSSVIRQRIKKGSRNLEKRIIVDFGRAHGSVDR